MSVQNALKFINTVSDDNEYRKSFYIFNSKQEIMDSLSGDDAGFSLAEFEDAVNMKHAKCQTYEEADHLKQIEMWFNLFR